MIHSGSDFRSGKKFRIWPDPTPDPHPRHCLNCIVIFLKFLFKIWPYTGTVRSSEILRTTFSGYRYLLSSWHLQRTVNMLRWWFIRAKHWAKLYCTVVSHQVWAFFRHLRAVNTLFQRTITVLKENVVAKLLYEDIMSANSLQNQNPRVIC